MLDHRSAMLLRKTFEEDSWDYLVDLRLGVGRRSDQYSQHTSMAEVNAMDMEDIDEDAL
jgi:hypothetical protein